MKKFTGAIGSIIMAVVVAIAVRVILPISPAFVLSLAIFFFLLERFLLKLEEDSATSRSLKKAMMLGAAVLTFVGVRLAADFLLGMPLVDTSVALSGNGPKFGVNVPQTLVLELLFLLPGMGIAHLLVYGKEAGRKTVYLGSVAAFALVLWQVKQPEHSQSAGRYAQSVIDVSSRNLSVASQENGRRASQRLAFFRFNVDAGQLLVQDSSGILTSAGIPGTIMEGEPIQLVGDSEKDVNGQKFLSIHLRDQETGLFAVDGSEVEPFWVDSQCLLIPTDQDSVDYRPKERTVIRSDKGKTWTIYFYTNEPVLIDEKFPIGRKFAINFSPEIGLAACDTSDPEKLYPIKAGSVKRMDVPYALHLKCQEYSKIVLRFI